MDKREGVTGNSAENFCLTVPKTFLRGTLLCFRKLLVSKKFALRDGRVSRFSVELALSHSTETFQWGTLSCFRNFLVSNFLVNKAVLQIFLENFCLYLLKTIAWDPSDFQKVSSIGFFAYEERGVSGISNEIFLSQSTDKLCWGNLLCFKKLPLSKTFLVKDGTTVFCWNFFISQYQKVL